MLLQRVLTAVVLVPLAIAAVWFLPTGVVVAIFGAMVIIGAWEWTHLMRVSSTTARIMYVGMVMVLGLVLWGLSSAHLWSLGVLIFAALWWLVAFIWVLNYPAGLPVDSKRTGLAGVVGLLIMLPSIPAIALLHSKGAEWVLILFVIIWAADTGAYFAGRSLGRRKLAPQVSPGKTWEGFVGGLVGGVSIGLVAIYLLTPFASGISYLWFALAAALIVATSVVGDLAESMFKRHAAIKDSGTLFPGHGGVLDRLDSMFAAAPILALLSLSI